MRVPKAHFIPEEPTILKGDLVSSKISAKFGSYGNTVQVRPSDHGIVINVIGINEIECLFHGRLTWWAEDEIEAPEVFDDA